MLPAHIFPWNCFLLSGLLFYCPHYPLAFFFCINRVMHARSLLGSVLPPLLLIYIYVFNSYGCCNCLDLSLIFPFIWSNLLDIERNRCLLPSFLLALTLCRFITIFHFIWACVFLQVQHWFDTLQKGRLSVSLLNNVTFMPIVNPYDLLNLCI